MNRKKIDPPLQGARDAAPGYMEEDIHQTLHVKVH